MSPHLWLEATMGTSVAYEACTIGFLQTCAVSRLMDIALMILHSLAPRPGRM